MDRGGDGWNGDAVAGQAAGEAAGAGARTNRADERPPEEEVAPRPRSVEHSAADGVRMNDTGEGPQGS